MYLQAFWATGIGQKDQQHCDQCNDKHLSNLDIWIFFCDLFLQPPQLQPALHLAVSHVLSHLSIKDLSNLSKLFLFLLKLYPDTLSDLSIQSPSKIFKHFKIKNLPGHLSIKDFQIFPNQNFTRTPSASKSARLFKISCLSSRCKNDKANTSLRSIVITDRAQTSNHWKEKIINQNIEKGSTSLRSIVIINDHALTT